jgi:hypothetical protein
MLPCAVVDKTEVKGNQMAGKGTRSRKLIAPSSLPDWANTLLFPSESCLPHHTLGHGKVLPEDTAGRQL